MSDSYLDEIGFPWDDGDGDGGEEEAPDGTPLGVARSQCADSRVWFSEGPEGTFKAIGTRMGAGYAEAAAVVDPLTGNFTIDINSNLRLSPENIPAARKLFRRENESFIVSGLCVDDEGWVRFTPEPGNVLDGDDMADFVGKGLHTLHDYAWYVAALEAGRPAWELGGGKGGSGRAGLLRRLAASLAGGSDD